MPRRADCRLCIYFRPLDGLPPELVERAYGWVHANRPGERPLGWCQAFNRPVTYYVGYCGRFTRRPPPRSRSLVEFLGGGEG